MSAPLQTRTAVFTPAKLEELASDSANEVYDFVHDQPARVLPMKEVRLKLLAIRGVVVAQSKAHPEWKWVHFKKHLRTTHPELAELATTHPKMYDVASHPKTDYARDFAPMLMEVDVFERMQAGKLTQKEAMQTIERRLQEHFLLPEGKTKADVTPWSVSTRPG